MIRLVAGAIILLLALPAHADTHAVTIRNGTSETIRGVALAPPGSAAPGQNRLVSQLPPGSEGRFTYSTGCPADLRITFESGRTEDHRGIDVCSDPRVIAGQEGVAGPAGAPVAPGTPAKPGKPGTTVASSVPLKPPPVVPPWDWEKHHQTLRRHGLTVLPTLFVSHGAPDLVLRDTPARHFLAGLAARFPRPRAILAVSAHWETNLPMLATAAHPSTIHDFGRFDDRLFAMRYPAPGDPALAARAAALLADAGITAGADPARGFDHGVWVPLMLMFPGADIPVVPLSIQHTGPADHLAIGQALGALRNEGVLILASGSFTHDLGRFRGQPIEAAAPEDVNAFGDWFDTALIENRTEDLLAYRSRAPFSEENHPTEEHLLPLFVALGAAGPAAPAAKHLHQSTTFGVLRMDAYAFG